ncbi:MAG: LamG-like jellyroll fold domain-containing protein, partial [Planctomycetota bacterium]
SFDRNEYYRLQINGEVAGDGQVGWHVMTIDGATEVQVDYGSVTRVDDGLWHHVCGVFDRGTSTIFIDGLPEPSTTGGSTYGVGDLVRYGFIGANSEATDFNGARGVGTGITGDLSEIRVYDRALTQDEILQVMRGDSLMAWDLRPTNGRILEVDSVSAVSWMPGDKASQHDVYFGTGAETVTGADDSDGTGAYRGRQSATTYRPPEGFDWGTTYFWRIDELNNDGTTTKGRVRTIKMADYLVVDSFEDYNDYPPDEIWSTWIDGFGTPTNGATAGYPDPDFTLREHYVETAIVNSGRQSMPLFYDNNFKFSEAQRTLSSQRDWTKHGVEELSLRYVGDPCNVAERMYVAVANATGAAAVVYHEDPNLITGTWTEWVIPLHAFADQGVNLTNVDSIAIGFGTRGDATRAGGSGVVYFDDIRLYRKRPFDPGDDGLIAHYAFENDANDSSANALHGTIMGDPSFADGASGTALDFDGDGDYVDCGNSPLFDVTEQLTVAAWINIRAIAGDWRTIIAKGDNAWRMGSYQSTQRMHFAFEDGSRGWQAANSDSEVPLNEWHHVCGTYDLVNGGRIYIDGVLNGSNPDIGGITLDAYNVYIGDNSQNTGRFWDGLIDEVVIYNRALSELEIRYLAGD